MCWLALIVLVLLPACGSAHVAMPPATETATVSSETPSAPARHPSVIVLPSLVPGATATAADTSATTPDTLADDLLAFLRLPYDYRTRFIHYATIDRTDGEGQVRRMYVSPDAFAAIGRDLPLPDGTLIVMEIYVPARSATGDLLIDDRGYLIPERLDRVFVRQKGQSTGNLSGERVPEGIRNSDWSYATIDVANAAPGTRDNATCHACHQQAAGWDYVFTYPQLVASAETGTVQYGVCDLIGRQPCALPDR